ncbi:hypothetical protein Taro_014899 [Colocasia esculenta]|uniref:Uncharacterized protein n=1 Tax=Colocasia esculenta TaxID=4460 RepID=A0A843UKJ9_COLES|nr:hypothetical protein [Colocasia esculenta]
MRAGMGAGAGATLGTRASSCIVGRCMALLEVVGSEEDELVDAWVEAYHVVITICFLQRFLK